MLVKDTQYQTPWDKQNIVLLSKVGRRIHILQVCKKYGYSLDLFHGLIIPLPTYGISVWGTASYNEYFFLKLISFRRKQFVLASSQEGHTCFKPSTGLR